MYRQVRHGVYEPVRLRPILRRLLFVLGVLLIIATIVLLIMWRKAAMALPVGWSTTILCTGNIDFDSQPCGPTAAEIAHPGMYAHAALATGAAGAGCLIGAYVLSRRSPCR